MKTLPFVGAANPAQKIYQDLSGMPVTHSNYGVRPSLKITNIGGYNEFYDENYNQNMCELVVSLDSYITGYDYAEIRVWLFEKEFIDNYFPDGISNDFDFVSWSEQIEQELGYPPYIMTEFRNVSYGSLKIDMYDWSGDKDHFPQIGKDYVLVAQSFGFYFNGEQQIIGPSSTVTMLWKRPVEKTDTLEITENGSYDVKDYKNVNVDVEMHRIALVIETNGSCGSWISGTGEIFYAEPNNYNRFVVFENNSSDVVLVGTYQDCENWAEQNGFIIGHTSVDNMPNGYDGIAPGGYTVWQLQPCEDCNNYQEHGYESEEQCNCDYYGICNEIEEV